MSIEIIDGKKVSSPGHRDREAREIKERLKPDPKDPKNRTGKEVKVLSPAERKAAAAAEDAPATEAAAEKPAEDKRKADAKAKRDAKKAKDKAKAGEEE